MRNFKLVIEYDGTGYHGWQSQSNTCTIQGTIEDALKRMTGQSVTLTGSGRTDAGVHATGQVANFCLATRLTSEMFANGLNSLLPADIVIKDCATVDKTFHARFSARAKVYDYRILNRPTPAALFRQYAWHIKKALELNAMRRAMVCLEGKHEFSAFEGVGSPRSHSVRTVVALTLTGKDADGYVVFSIEADGFLRHMVRNIVGTLVDVGLRKMTPEDFEDILISRDRKQAGITAPPHGLFLREVKYESCYASSR
ncbi:MAG TPA: tRNA pseudouridine(38-40) synthase TruA [Desulfobacterales bacterium]|nr:tRNA pseudouridine(38-40) synthase TruA [Desulfobacterales bacterium]